MGKQAHTQAADPMNTVPTINLDMTLYPWELGHSSIWLWFYHQHLKPRDPGGVPPTRASANTVGMQTWVPAVDFEVACELAPAPQPQCKSPERTLN